MVLKNSISNHNGKYIVIDPGHGGKDPGATYADLEEKTINLFVALDLGFRLQNLNGNYHTFLTRPTDIYIPPTKRADFANRLNADAFISIHVNADIDQDLLGFPEAKGEEIWIRPKDPKSRLLAVSLSSWVNNIFPEEPFRGIKESRGLIVLNNTVMPAALIELGFIDKSSSPETFSSMKTLQKISGFIARGTDQYFVQLKGGD